MHLKIKIQQMGLHMILKSGHNHRKQVNKPSQ